MILFQNQDSDPWHVKIEGTAGQVEAPDPCKP